ncbi:hypothetical protein E2P81_ATG06989 [Venturia nashicola]|nr:hypothetical protein E2P81_ATG06989 [Venturia nashicola]
MQATAYATIVIALLIPLAGAQLGVNFASGYDFKVYTGNEILRTETVYTPGAMEKNIKGILFLWPGIWVPETGLAEIQSRRLLKDPRRGV